MATKVTRDHHLLTRNLKLNGNYLSNDGDDEGINIADDGDVTLTSTDTQLKIAYDATNYATFVVAVDGALTIDTEDADAEEADIILVPNGEVKIDRNSLSTTSQTTRGLEIDYDHTGSTLNNQTMIGLDLNARSLTTTGGSQVLYGAKIDGYLHGASTGAGVTTSYGLHLEMEGDGNALEDNVYGALLKVTGTADNNVGLYINCVDGGEDLKIVSSASILDWFKIQVEADGVTTFTTNEQGGGTGANININPDGNFNVSSGVDIILNANGGDITFKDGSTTALSIDMDTTDGAAFFLNGAGDMVFGVDDGDRRLYLYDKGGEYIEGNGSRLSIVSGGNITLDATSNSGLTGILMENAGTLVGDITVHHNATYLTLYENGGASTNDYAELKVEANGATTIQTVDGAGSNANLLLISDGVITLDSITGNFVLKNNATEFSVNNSAYAGMILGYTVEGINQTPATYTLTNSNAIVASATHHVSFKAPPSGVVEIEVQINYDAGTSGQLLRLGLSDNATILSNSLPAYLTQQVYEASRSINDMNVIHKWIVTGLTAGDTYKWYLTAYVNTTAGTPKLQWGSDSIAENPVFIMKATALPTAVTDFAIYS